MLANLSLRNKFLLTTIGGVILLSIAVLFFAKPLLQRKLYLALERRGVSIAGGVAFNAANYILEEKYLLLDLMLKDYKSDEHDIVYIFVADDHGNILAHTFDNGFPLGLKHINNADTTTKYTTRHLLTEEGEIVDIAFPLLQGQMGKVHVGISAKQMRQDVNSLVRWVIWLVMGILLAGVGVAILASRWITGPILGLAQAAAKVAAGDLDQRVAVSSQDEIGQLEMVFNDMMEKRQQREEEREKLIRELQEAMAEVRTLTGMLPICASCKKIRDDKGYWTKIESYIRDHSEVEFSHSLCPECVEKLYPDFHE
jgi:two-component system cell cycle sensor histidine kinase/response regulator CckA